jgi:hypothetical protein
MNSILTSVFVVKTRRRSERVDPFSRGAGRESKADVASITDLLMQTVLSHEG